MKVAILGGGFTGLTASYYLAKKGHSITIFEKEKILGGLASGFKAENWDWFLERAVHHIFANDYDILNFAKEVGFNEIFFQEPETASLYEMGPVSKFIPTSARDQRQAGKIAARLQEPFFSQHPFHHSNFRIFPLDTPQDLLKFPLLSLPEKLRAGFILAFLKFSPFFSFYERVTAQQFLKKTMGNQTWDILWQELFRKKFGKYAGNILASFIWARIKKRTKKLGYVEGGFQTFINFLEEKNKSIGVTIKKGVSVDQIIQNSEFRIQNEKFDAIISTLPTAVLLKIGSNILPTNYIKQLEKLKYLHAISLILEMDKPVLDKTYWLNIAVPEIPIMGLFQQTNFVDKSYYDDNHVLYIGNYVEGSDRRLKMNKEELLNFYLSYISKISNFKFQISNCFLFKAPWAQPIYDKDFIKNKPNFTTPVKNFYIANLDMTYPYDRGTNYAVKLGREVARLVNSGTV